MSGHSKWHSIKHKKGAADAKRGKEFTKLGNAIAVAARDGADPETNFRLRLAIDRAKQANVPNANIEKAVLRGSGQLEGEQIQEVVYEGYGPGGIAVIIEGATDNKNRTYSDIRTAFTKNGGNMAESGAVAYQFDRRGIIIIDNADVEELTLRAIDEGAVDVSDEDGVVTVYTDAKELARTVDSLRGDYEVKSSELGFVPQNLVLLEDESTATKAVKLMDALDELDDVTNTYSNFDIAEGIVI